ncbi:CDP-diacylglycerol--glycerol-3-phosphate 3-phosphatidyltransferase [Thalassoporum mexicanum PCC 7367]|uniref:CDP-diacylglycerol--glycerol-3-phosphate 3-phosphatidyltransferase n=1 Tax=Thalassoporum mexicanum TaxID=3457544 RepID=UPI00029F8F4B|nr:CDP-diacylglycerol--glycerol-3-phosphate 3-phosphatidyltransferase [Pseudanabaena sp. PCC 7367]AFY70405.1 CDP-diacylglycerol--glycerol-3-phosphate 3-phosphatidyltransferase [Pseudanabaena sp. PCC 7367]
MQPQSLEPPTQPIASTQPIITLPTWITLSRLLAVPVILVVLNISQTPQSYYIATGAFLLAALTDWLDGYLARKLNLVSDLGKFLDPLVDKLLVAAPLLMLVQFGHVPAWGVFVILARELLVTAWRGIGTTPATIAPITSITPITPIVPIESYPLTASPANVSDPKIVKKQPSRVIGANLWGKAKTVVQIVAIAMLLLQLPGAIGLFWLAVALTVISGITYVLPIHHL